MRQTALVFCHVQSLARGSPGKRRPWREHHSRFNGVVTGGCQLALPHTEVSLHHLLHAMHRATFL